VKPHGSLRVVKDTPEGTGIPLGSYTMDALLTWPCDKVLRVKYRTLVAVVVLDKDR
jgi:hypothetical protein